MANFSVRSYRRGSNRRFTHRTQSRKFPARVIRKAPRVTTFNRSLRFPAKFRLIKNSAVGRFFKHQSSTNVRVRISPKRYTSRPVLRKPEFYTPLKFPNGRVRIIRLLSTEQTQAIRQDANYFFISKADLEKVGLVPTGDNSAEELISALLLHWVDSLDSNRIKVSFYRYIKIEENTKWYELQSFLVNVIATMPQGSFPSPSSFLI